MRSSKLSWVRRWRKCAGRWASDATFYNWKKKHGGLGPSEVRWLKQLEEENAKLKKLVADLSLDKAMLQDVLTKNSEGHLAYCTVLGGVHAYLPSKQAWPC
jgi:hypothetical protein